jgi:hypothetical protein
MPVVEHAIEVAAPPEACWRVFADLDGWPRWFPFLSQVTGRLEANGALRLRFAAGPVPFPVDVAIRELEPGARVRWVGGALGVQGDHSYAFTATEHGTRVSSREEFSGVGARLIPRVVLARLDGEVERSMRKLKALVEALPPP